MYPGERFCSTVGLCGNFLSNIKENFWPEWLQGWEHYQGEIAYPVESAVHRHETINLTSVYRTTEDVRYDCSSPYGRMRRNLAGHLANYLTEHFNEWSIYERATED